MENLQLDINNIALLRGVLPAHTHLVNGQEIVYDYGETSEQGHPEQPESYRYAQEM